MKRSSHSKASTAPLPTQTPSAPPQVQEGVASTSRKYPTTDVKKLYGLSAAYCAYPGCHRRLVVDATDVDASKNIGKIAHIVAHSDGGPRSDPEMSMEQRDSYENWVLLCPTHHDIVDVQPNSFTVSDLQQWKLEQERWIREATTREVPNVTFAELEVVCKAVQTQTAASDDLDLTLTPLSEKMRKNDLTSETHVYIIMGVGMSRVVEKFVNGMARLDYSFPNRLRAGFVEEYNRLKSQNISGDALFESLRQFACSGACSNGTDNHIQFRLHAAALGVLSYLFETCEVFER